jgi:hypothetical protein
MPNKKPPAPLGRTIDKIETCPHYCSVGGHLWDHICERDNNGISDCRFKLFESGYINPVVKFFIPCEMHRKLPRK